MTDILLEGVRETLGTPEKNLLEKAPLLFGERGSCGIAHRIGEASFRYFLRIIGKQYLLTENSYRLMNSQHRIIFGLKQLAEFAQQNCGARIEIYEDENRWYWQVLKNESIQDWNQLYSPYTFGLLREFFTWTSGGRYYPMEESPNKSRLGILFQVAINKRPLGN